MYGQGTMSGRRGGVWDLAEGRQPGRHHQTGVWESGRCLGKMQLLRPGPVCTCPKKEGGRRPPTMPSSPHQANPRWRERRWD